jgi:hypothetical protein
MAVITLLSVGLLLAWDLFPHAFPARAHDILGALPLGLIAFAYLLYEALRRPGFKELTKGILLVIAFLFWAANQLWPDHPQATLFNDVAIALFVFDIFLVIVGWPPGTPDEAFAETYVENEGKET